MSHFSLLHFGLFLLFAMLALAACSPLAVETPAALTPAPGVDAMVTTMPTAVPTTVPTRLFAPAPTFAPAAPPTRTPFAGPVTITLGPDRDGAQQGTVTLVLEGAQTRVTVSMQGSEPGVPQPAHIHKGSCPDQGPVEFPLSNVLDGKSVTVVRSALAGLLDGTYSIHIHKSTAENTKFVACAALPRVSP